MQTKYKSLLVILVVMLLALTGGYFLSQSASTNSFYAYAAAKSGHTAKDLQTLIDNTKSGGVLKLNTYYGDTSSQSLENGSHTLLASVVYIKKPITIDLMGYSLLAICLNISVGENQSVEICDSLSSASINSNRGASLNGVYPCSINARSGKVTLTNLTVYDSPAIGRSSSVSLGLYVSGADVTINGGKYINNFATTAVNGINAESILFSAGSLTINHAQSVVEPDYELYDTLVCKGSALALAKTAGLTINAGYFRSYTTNSAIYYSNNITDEATIRAFMGSDYGSSLEVMANNGKEVKISCQPIATKANIKLSETSDNVYYSHSKVFVGQEHAFYVPIVGLPTDAQYTWTYKSKLEDIDFVDVSSDKFFMTSYFSEENYGVYICDIVNGENTYRYIDVISPPIKNLFKNYKSFGVIYLAIILLVFFIAFLFIVLHSYKVRMIENNREIASIKFDKGQIIVLPNSLAKQSWFLDKDCTQAFKDNSLIMPNHDVKLYCLNEPKNKALKLGYIYYIEKTENDEDKDNAQKSSAITQAKKVQSKKKTASNKAESKKKDDKKSSSKTKSNTTKKTASNSKSTQNSKTNKSAKTKNQKTKKEMSTETKTLSKGKKTNSKKALNKYEVPDEQKITKKRRMKRKVVANK